ncbi:UNVERIFIED_CONTAM: hypothetical protein HDU68_008432 [Siphonaria sp. JEL0065]|nr:hypothetical protein HDU68_008432 [Siphonaria sp. JEL0065]
MTTVADCQALYISFPTLFRDNDSCCISASGVLCINDRVTELFLSKHGIVGSIPPQLAALDQLTTLDLSNNQLSGAVPSELGFLSKLTALNLSNNLLTGSTPSLSIVAAANYLQNCFSDATEVNPSCPTATPGYPIATVIDGVSMVQTITAVPTTIFKVQNNGNAVVLVPVETVVQETRLVPYVKESSWASQHVVPLAAGIGAAALVLILVVGFIFCRRQSNVKQLSIALVSFKIASLETNLLIAAGRMPSLKTVLLSQNNLNVTNILVIRKFRVNILMFRMVNTRRTHRLILTWLLPPRKCTGDSCKTREIHN